MHYPEGGDLHVAAQVMLVYQSLLLPYLQTYLRTGKHTTSVPSHPTVTWGTGYTLKLKLTICSTGGKLHLISRYWAEDRTVSQGDAMHLLRAVLFFFFLI